VGDEVYGRSSLIEKRGGSYAELALASAANLARKPRDLTFEQAAALPVAALTAIVGFR
jgi:NADPH:quinone reductase-like Zn-dependent oxidoreductase